MEQIGRIRAWAEEHLVLVDTVAAVVGAVGLVIVAGRRPESADWADGRFGVLLLIGMVLPLALRRRWPVAVLVATLGFAFVYQQYQGHETLSDLDPPAMVPVAIALYTVAANGDRRRSLAVGGGMIALFLTLGVIDADGGLPQEGSAGDLGWIVTALALGEAVRNRRAYVAELEERTHLALRTREEEARRRVDEERLRIARELHDVVTHSIAMIAVQSGMAAHVFDSQPEQARAALQEIRQASKVALGELRATLGLLRPVEEASQEDEARAPEPGLGQVDRLVAQMRGAGIEVEVERSGAPRLLPAAVDLAAYRIVQEALTNVLRHAGPARVTVGIEYRVDGVDLVVADDGRGAAVRRDGVDRGGGLGLLGMRERASVVGGTLWAGPRGGGGFEVRASLPVGGGE